MFLTNYNMDKMYSIKITDGISYIFISFLIQEQQVVWTFKKNREFTQGNFVNDSMPRSTCFKLSSFDSAVVF